MGQSFEIRKEVVLPATPGQVWDAIATGAGLAAWFMPMEIDAGSDMVVAWEPGARLAVRTPEGPDGATQAFEYLIEARHGGSTVLRFVHSGFLGDDWSDEFESMTSAGWDMYLHTLAEYLRHFPGRPAVYVEAEGPHSSADPARWPSLVRALGLSDPAMPGERVRVDLGGGASVEGVVDYATASFIGLRTADALIRFHGRAPIGMTVAVSHHAYVPGFDLAGATKAWESWLVEAFA